jgi:hypothetical protein
MDSCEYGNVHVGVHKEEKRVWELLDHMKKHCYMNLVSHLQSYR